MFQFSQLVIPLLANLEAPPAGQCNNLTGPQIFTIAVAIIATFAGVILAKVFKDKDDQNH